MVKPPTRVRQFSEREFFKGHKMALANNVGLDKSLNDAIGCDYNPGTTQ